MKLILYLFLLFSFLSFDVTDDVVAKENKSDAKFPDALMLRFPDVSSDNIVFSYAGDLWIVPKTGGVARRLSSPPGTEAFPRFSPDGKEIAFSGNYDGDTDVYIIPEEGGEPLRLTHHPEDDLVVAWFPDGKNILFKSKMDSPSNRFNRFFKQNVVGGLPEKISLPFGELASFNEDGDKLAFQYLSREFRNWKRYKGGMATDIWILDLNDKTTKRLTDYQGLDSFPMWHENRIYFLSDRGLNNKLNIWYYDTTSKEFNQITDFGEYDVKWPSIGPEDIVFENGGKLYLLSLSDHSINEIDVVIPFDKPNLRPVLKDLSDNIDNFSISPTGIRALFGARGEVITVPVNDGTFRNITNTSRYAERFPAWSPDGEYIAYFSDKSGEYELYIRNSDGKNEETQLTKHGTLFRYQPVWSPDSTKIAFGDKSGSLQYLDIKNKKMKLVDKDDIEPIDHYSWSPDGKWITYTKTTNRPIKSVMLYNTETGKTHQITPDFYNDNNPVFDKGSKFIFFYSDRELKPVYGDMDSTWIYPNSTGIYAVVLGKDDFSPINVKNDEEVGTKSDKSDKSDELIVDIDGIYERIVKLPVEPGNFGKLDTVKDKVVFVRKPFSGAPKNNGPKGNLSYYDFNNKKEGSIIKGVGDYNISGDGKKIIYRSNDKFGVVEFGDNKKVGDGELDLGELKVWIDPKEEWAQIYDDSWRIIRDFFYDPNMHGADWQKIYDRYESQIPFLTSRADLNYIIGEMISELNSSHAYVGGGDVEEPEEIFVGLLGSEIEFDEKTKLYRIGRIFDGGLWETDIRSPLNQPGIDVQEGDYLIAVNGKKVDTTKDPWFSFQGVDPDGVLITINSKPTFEGSREIFIKPLTLEEDSKLRYLDWVERNRKKVESSTSGRAGYIYVPDTGRFGQSELVRQFIPQQNKEALIIDERFNGGGQIPDRFIELLNRPLLNYWARRDFKDLRTPFISHTGPKVMIINGWAGSGGDAFPYYFKKAGLGPLVGKRTLGGLIGIGGNPGLIDGGYITAPTYAFWNLDGEWDIEGYGVEPDFEVEDLPENLSIDTDPQLEKSIEVINNLIDNNESIIPERPGYPDRTGNSDS